MYTVIRVVMYCASVFSFYELNQARCNKFSLSSDKITNNGLPHFSVASRALQSRWMRVKVPLSDLLPVDHLHEGVTVQVNARVIGAAAVKPPALTPPVAEPQQYR